LGFFSLLFSEQNSSDRPKKKKKEEGEKDSSKKKIQHIRTEIKIGGQTNKQTKEMINEISSLNPRSFADRIEDN